MDQLLDWLDDSDVFASLGHTWPWAVITAALAIGALAGVVNLARHYGGQHNAQTD